MNFQETLDYMYRLLPMYQRVGKTAFKKDLTNTIKLLDYLGNPHHQFKSIHIAGTNGKGSSAHMLASILQTAGYKTGLYTSPHLKQFTERIRINGIEVDEQFVCDFIERLKGLIVEIEPSFFEITVAMAFEYFARMKVDIAVVEVGMGGRFDSTNVLIPIVSLITSISYDHTDFLGNTLPEIAFEKAGIIKPAVPVVISETQTEIAHIFNDKASTTGSPIYYAVEEFQVNAQNATEGSFNFIVRYQENEFEIQSDLGGIYQVKNIPGVLKVVDLLNDLEFSIDDQQIIKGFKSVGENTGFKGRWQKLAENPLIICDTAHNESGVKLIFEQIEKMDHEHLHVIWGAVEGKSPEKIFQYFPNDAIYYFCEPKLPRALKSEVLMDIAAKKGLVGQVIKDVNDAISEAKACAGTNDLIFIGGSNFVIAEINDL